jgi:hypothetical protein
MWRRLELVMNNFKYFITPKYSVAMNRKVASSSIARGIIESFYPEIEAEIQTKRYPPHKTPDNCKWHYRVPKEEFPSRTPVILVRDPIDRFISGVLFRRIENIDDLLDSLEKNTCKDLHFAHQSSFVGQGYPFEYIEDFSRMIGLTRLLHINRSDGASTTLTKEQIRRIEIHYSKDFELREAILRA